MRVFPTVAFALWTAVFARSGGAQTVASRSVGTQTTLGDGPRVHRERVVPHLRVELPTEAYLDNRRNHWERTDLWARHTLYNWLRLSGPRRLSWAVVAFGSATLGTALMLRSPSRTSGDAFGGLYANRPDLSLPPGPLGSGCGGACGLALASGATVLTSGLMQLFTPGHHPFAENYARAFVATQSGLWILGVMGSL